jgi:SPP1 family predicted phage head-tail adaptor
MRGDYRARIEFERDAGGGRDAAGQPIVNWCSFLPPLKRWAKPIPSRGRSYWAAWGVAQPQAEITGIYEIAYDKRLYSLLAADKSKIRGRIGDRIIYIEAFSDPTEQRKIIQLIVKEDL